ncbi:MAG: 2-phospho-L-lactate transferase [Dehalococcoidia bacterium]
MTRVYVVLAGGTGGSRFVTGLTALVGEHEVTVIANVADDDQFYGLHVSPDIDSNIYALAHLIDVERGWGLRGDTFHFMEAGLRFRQQDWFRIGDRDLATHQARSDLLAQGLTLTEATSQLAAAFGVKARILPATDDRLRSRVVTAAGSLPFQEYLVKRHAADPVVGYELDGIASARPTQQVLDAIRSAVAIFLAPSNPVASIGPILALPGMRDAISRASAPVVAVSPIIAGQALQPPSGEMMSGLGIEVSAAGVAGLYAGLADAFLFDVVDAGLQAEISALGLSPHVANTIMRGSRGRKSVARAALRAAGLTAA